MTGCQFEFFRRGHGGPGFEHCRSSSSTRTAADPGYGYGSGSKKEIKPTD